MRKTILLGVLAVAALAGIVLAANHVVTVTWPGPGHPITVEPNPVVVQNGDTVEFRLSEGSFGVCAISAGPPLNWDLGPLYPGYPGVQSPPIDVPPGTYEYTIECGSAKLGPSGEMLDFGVGFVTVTEDIPTLSTWQLFLLGLVILIAGVWIIHRRKNRLHSN